MNSVTQASPELLAAEAQEQNEASLSFSAIEGSQRIYEQVAENISVRRANDDETPDIMVWPQDAETQALRTVVNKAQHETQVNNWWLPMVHQSVGSSPLTPYEEYGTPAEEIVFQPLDEGGPVTVRNFTSENIDPAVIQSLQETVEEISQLLSVPLSRVIGNIAIVPDLGQTPDGMNRHGLAPRYRDVIFFDVRDLARTIDKSMAEDLSRKRASLGIDEDPQTILDIAEGQPFVKYLATHEIGHKLYDFLHNSEARTVPYFRNNTQWDWGGDRKVDFDGSRPEQVAYANTHQFVMTALTSTLYPNGSLEDSPPTAYASTHLEEDYAESLACLIFSPDKLDPIRRDSILSELQSINGSIPTMNIGGPQHMYKRVKRSGDDIKIPQVEIKARQVKTYGVFSKPQNGLGM